MLNPRKKIELSPRLKLGIGRGYSQNQILKVIAFICLILAIGLSLNAVRIVIQGEKNKANQSFNVNAPQVLGATDTKSGAEQSIFIEYKVQKGDTLFNLSQKFNINWTTIATLNNLKSPFSIRPGQILKIPK
ncbi:MAG: LysM domain-containing protein [Candidatus Berkelbacteria bacterium]|nr:LysM domain-containing protein [Candidatus Berkelbacteria bacterium]